MITDILKSAYHPSEVLAMVRIKLSNISLHDDKEPLEKLAHCGSDRDFCYAVLNKVSRSFAVVIQQLPEKLKDPVCVFYLVLRGLDSIEDDMDYAAAKRLPLLRSFHEKLHDPQWHIKDVGDSHDYRVLLENFDRVIRTFQLLEEEYRHVIAD